MTLLKLSVAFMLLNFVPNAVAQAQAPTPDAGNDADIEQSVILLQAALDLTTPQAAKIRQLAATRRNEMDLIAQQTGPKAQKLMTLLDDPTSDPATVGKLSLELRAISKQVNVKQAETEKQLMGMLNPTQQQTVQALGRAAEIFVVLKKIGLIDPDLTDGIFMSGIKVPASATGATEK